MGLPMSRIRVLHIIGQIRRGGCESQLLGLCERLDKARFDLSVCWFVRMDEELDEEFARAGVQPIFLDKRAGSLWQFFRRLRRVIKETSPDIVHTWLFSANFWGRFAAMSCRVPRIVASDRCEVAMDNTVVRIAERLLASRTTRLANSLAVARSLEEHFGLPVVCTRVIYNAVQVPLPEREQARREIRDELGLPPDSQLVLMVGRCTWPKNYLMFIRVGQLVCGRFERAYFLAAGGGPEEASLRGQVQREGWERRIRFLGERPDIARLLAAADVFAFTSDSEGLPNAVLEAMAAGLPVVCTEFASAGEVILGPEHAVLVPCGDVDKMVDAVGRLLAAPEHCRDLGAAARDHVAARFSWERVVGETASVYEELMSSSLGR